MLTKADPREMDFPATAKLPQDSAVRFNPKIWLPKLFYDGLPWFYFIAGIGALAATIYIGAWYWIVPHYLLFSAACLHMCVIIIRRRRKVDVAPPTISASD